MKNIFVLFVVAAVIHCIASEKQYTNKFDGVDVDGVLANRRILSNYIKCLMDKGPCTQEGRELKKLLPDALQSDCSKCTETQKKNSQKVINYLRVNNPGDWKKLLEKYDANGTYRARHERQG